jgi:hypothetical protein
MKRTAILLLTAAALTTSALAADDGDFRPPADAQKVTYEELARSPQKYHERRVLLHGKVIQVKYADNDSRNAVALLADTSGKNLAIVRWQPRNDRARLVAGDTVDVWGIFVRLSFDNAYKVNEALPVIDAAQVSGAQH